MFYHNFVVAFLFLVPMVVRVLSGTTVDCVGGCGFYAVQNVNRSLCSKCYKQYCELHPEPEKPGSTAAAAPAAPAAGAAGASAAPEEPKVQTNTSRCWTCNKKIGLLGFKCRCSYTFCASHRYSDRHECPFDYKAQGKKELAQANPVIAAAKIDKF